MLLRSISVVSFCCLLQTLKTSKCFGRNCQDCQLFPVSSDKYFNNLHRLFTNFSSFLSSVLLSCPSSFPFFSFHPFFPSFAFVCFLFLLFRYLFQTRTPTRRLHRKRRTVCCCCIKRWMLEIAAPSLPPLSATFNLLLVTAPQKG